MTQTQIQSPSPPRQQSDEHVGAVAAQAAQQLGQLARDEFRLARAELAESRRNLGFGGGLLGAAGLLAFIAVQAFAATAIAALALVTPVWLAALIVALAAVLTAAVMALLGKKRMERVGPAFEESVDSLKTDVAVLKEGGSR